MVVIVGDKLRRVWGLDVEALSNTSSILYQCSFWFITIMVVQLINHSIKILFFAVWNMQAI